jgi:hypothetical protein
LEIPEIPPLDGSRIDFAQHWKLSPHIAIPQKLFGVWDYIEYDEADSLEKIFLDIKPTGWIYYELLAQAQLDSRSLLNFPTPVVECLTNIFFQLLPSKFYYGFFTDHVKQQWDDPGALNHQEFYLIFAKGECGIRMKDGLYVMLFAFYCICNLLLGLYFIAMILSS